MLGARGWGLGVSAPVLAVLAVLPLLVPELWVGFRLGLADTAWAVIAPSEQPLSVRSPSGLWAIGLALAWFGLAYRRRNFAPWEGGLVLVGGGAILARLGNGWVDAAALVVPLGRQLALVKLKPVVTAGLATICLAAIAATVVSSRPPELPVAASQAASQAARWGAASQVAQSSSLHGTVMADWRWAAELQHKLGPDRKVWAAAGLPSESPDFWLDYLRVAQGHERWAEILSQLHVDLVVLDAAGQQHRAADLVRSAADWRVAFDANGVLVAERVGL